MVKPWKVILPTLVIFAAGVLVGVFIQRSLVRPPVAPAPMVLSQQRFQERLKRELHLSPDQTNRIDKIFAESNERIKILWGLVGPEMQKELREVQDSIRSELNAEQRGKFEQLLKQSQFFRRPEGSRRGGKGTNQFFPTNSLPKQSG